jgi:hypothetical protein
MADKIAKFFAALGNAEIMTIYLCAASTLIFVVCRDSSYTIHLHDRHVMSPKFDNIESKPTHVDDSEKISLFWNN